MDPTVCLGTNHANILNEITKSCEKLITETQRDIELFRNEQKELYHKIHGIFEENNQFNEKFELLKSAAKKTTDQFRDDATRETLTNDAFKNFKKQIDYLQAENNDLRSLHKSSKITIENLEKEIQNYRNQLFEPTSVCEVKQKYATDIKLLESTIFNQNSELKEQAKLIEHLFEQKKQLRDHIENLQNSIEAKDKEIEKYLNTSETIVKLQEQLNEALRQNKELQKSLKTSREAIEERFRKEQSALQKVQEALAIAETAVADKEEVLKREKVVKEECDYIASTIGQIMEEAARKVERDNEAIRNKFIDKEKALVEEKAKLIKEVQNQKKFTQILDTRCNRFQQKFKAAMTDNEELAEQLECATKTLIEMEEKLAKIYCIKNNEAILQKRTDEQELEIQQYVEINKQLQDRYRTTINNFATNLKKEISRLENEVACLKAENMILKSQNSNETNG